MCHPQKITFRNVCVRGASEGYDRIVTKMLGLFQGAGFSADFYIPS